jgi:DNA-binding XRE family transcriptional regulator
MGQPKALKRYRSPARALMKALPTGLVRLRPRRYAEWKALRNWGKLPAWEFDSVGYRLRLARETAGLTQSALSRRLRCSQQAVAQAERWQSNPTVEFVHRWARACGSTARIEIA